MFSLLSPLSLWLGAFLVVPLAIHFLGRQKLQKQPFPSLLLVRERFSKSMHRHRLKNLLLLLLRTLLILCLILALANPTRQSFSPSVSKSETSLALIHNGIYGRLTLQKGQGSNGTQPGMDYLEAQKHRIHILDSVNENHTSFFPILLDGSRSGSRGSWTETMKESSERFGDYGEALTRMVATLDSRPGITVLHIPVFAWSDLLTARETLLRTLKEYPELQVEFTDYSDAGSMTKAFVDLTDMPAPDAPTIKLISRLHPKAKTGDGARVQVVLNDRLFQEINPTAGQAEVSIPLNEGFETTGKFILMGNGFASSEFHFCFPEAGEWILAHSGSAIASLPSLGRETYFRRVMHYLGTKDIPWEGVRPSGAGQAAAYSSLRLVYLANERNVDPASYAHAIEFIKNGGRLVVSVGRDTDIPMINRLLLQPLRMGRFGNIIEATSTSAVTVNPTELVKLGKFPPNLGDLGSVQKRFSFLPDSESKIILYQSSPDSTAILVTRDFHRGKILVWTTDIDDLNWTDVGINPITPLLHQAFQEVGLNDRAHNLSVASDSLFVFHYSSSLPEIRDPDGRVFTRVRSDEHRLFIGPFDRLGIHKIIQGQDTTKFAVNLAAKGMEPGSQNEDSRSEMLKALDPFKLRVQVHSAMESGTLQAGIQPLWSLLFLASILLLFVEAWVASVFSLKRTRI